jgi:hypothetical protein
MQSSLDTEWCDLERDRIVSYQSLSKPIMGFLNYFESPNVLEIGIDKGQTTIPLCHNLAVINKNFTYDGIDIKISDYIQTIFINMAYISLFGFRGHPEPSNIMLFQKNSLDILPKIIATGKKYNLILLDGDHNYYTVSRELKLLEQLCLPSTLIICDDYNTKWAHEDLYYSEYKEYSDVEQATKRKETDKVGVKAAVDEFVKNSNGKWDLGHPPGFDYCILSQPKNILGYRFVNRGPPMASNQKIEFMFNKSTCQEITNYKGE